MKFKEKLLIGWQEWAALPQIKIPLIKVKVDTGAKTSALHAFNIQPYRRNNKRFVRFDVHPIQGDYDIVVHCTAPVHDVRQVMSSNAQAEQRYVIRTKLAIGNRTKTIELTLSNRDPLRFRMLLGREAIRPDLIVDPAKALRLGKKKFDEVYEPYI